MAAGEIQPLVSVIIPGYNRPVLLREAADSVLTQTFSHLELIIVDDGSDDTGTRPAIESVRLREPGRVRVLRQEHSGMPGQVRNRGAAEARGKYIAFLDSDDLWKPEKVTLQVEYFSGCMRDTGRPGNSPVRICHTREIWLRDGREVSQAGQRHKRRGDIFRDALKKCIIGPSTVMMERSLFLESGGFREDQEIAEDYEFWLRITGGNCIGYIDEPLVVKRAGSWHQLSEKYGHIEYFRLLGLKDLVDSGFFSGAQKAAAAEELAKKCGIYAAGCRKRGRTGEAEAYERLAREYRPD